MVSKRTIYLYLLSHPGATRAELAEGLNSSISAIGRSIRECLKKKEFVVEKNRRGYKYFINTHMENRVGEKREFIGKKTLEEVLSERD